MRMTQYIGLSQKAIDFLEKHNSVKLCNYHMTKGMFNEPIMGAIYECTLQRKGMYSCPSNEYMENYKEVFVEVVQAEVWSSGPMIFTCLQKLNTNERIGEWTEEEIYV